MTSLVQHHACYLNTLWPCHGGGIHGKYELSEQDRRNEKKKKSETFMYHISHKRVKSCPPSWGVRLGSDSLRDGWPQFLPKREVWAIHIDFWIWNIQSNIKSKNNSFLPHDWDLAIILAPVWHQTTGNANASLQKQHIIIEDYILYSRSFPENITILF